MSILQDAFPRTDGSFTVGRCGRWVTDRAVRPERLAVGCVRTVVDGPGRVNAAAAERQSSLRPRCQPWPQLPATGPACPGLPLRAPPQRPAAAPQTGGPAPSPPRSVALP